MNLVFTTNQTQRLDIFLRSELPSKIESESKKLTLEVLVTGDYGNIIVIVKRAPLISLSPLCY